MPPLPKKNASIEKEPLKILLVDDIPANLLTLEGILEDESRILMKSLSGNEALKIIMEEPIDLILLDIQMPDMDGVEVAQLLRANPKTKHIPIIFVSAIAKSERPSFSEFEAGSFDFIPKPLDIAETQKIVSIFESACRYRRQAQKYQEQIRKLNDHSDQFLYILSHDLNAPLRAIDNLVLWLEEDVKKGITEETQENISLLKNRVGKMKLLLDGLLSFARAGKMQECAEDFSVYDLIEEIMDDEKKRHALVANIDAPANSISTNKQALQRVLCEVIKNAVYFNHNPSCEITVLVKPLAQALEFSIIDNGPGIKPQQQKMIFDIFQTLPSPHPEQTSGVGLSIVKKLVEDRGGKVWISPTCKTGTQVNFTWFL
jgi:signal transduction histidine kinase